MKERVPNRKRLETFLNRFGERQNLLPWTDEENVVQSSGERNSGG